MSAKNRKMSLEAREAARAERSEARRKKNRRTVITLLASTAVIILAVVLTVNLIYDSGAYIRDKTAFSCGETKITQAMAIFCFYEQYNSFLSSYSETTLKSMGLDTSKPLSSQKSYFGDETWLQYFAESTSDAVSSMLRCCEAARKNGFTISDEDESNVSESLATLRKAAMKEKLSLDAYLSKHYCRGLKEGDVTEVLKLNSLASRYYEATAGGSAYSDDDIAKYYAENSALFTYADYDYFVLSYENATEMKANRIVAETLAGTKSYDEWSDFVKSRYKEQHPDYSNEKLEESLKNLHGSVKQTGATDELGKWLYDAERKVGDTTVISDSANSKITVYRVSATAHRREYLLANISVCTFDTADFASEQEAKKLVETLFTGFNSGEKSEKRFNDIFGQYGSFNAGDVDIAAGINETAYWLTDSARTDGDCRMFTTDSGYAVVLYRGAGEASWKHSVKEKLSQLSDDKFKEDLAAIYTVTYDDGYLSRIEA